VVEAGVPWWRMRGVKSGRTTGRVEGQQEGRKEHVKVEDGVALWCRVV
jgi:hypothetical protein